MGFLKNRGAKKENECRMVRAQTNLGSERRQERKLGVMVQKTDNTNLDDSKKRRGVGLERRG